jgi:5-formyltetrahydrofolate cyclo-ligase
MLDYPKFKLKLNNIYKKQRKHIKEYQDIINKARKEKQTAEQIEILKSEDYFGYREYEEEINLLITRNLLRKANKLMIPIPRHSDEEMWERCQYDSSYFLTRKGMSELRALIRQEKRENMALYLPWITALIGIIGAITGLMAVILK